MHILSCSNEPHFNQFQGMKIQMHIFCMAIKQINLIEKVKNGHKIRGEKTLAKTDVSCQNNHLLNPALNFIRMLQAIHI